MSEFDGKTFDSAADGARLRGQYMRVWQVMADGQWHTLPEIKAKCDRLVGGGADTPQAISARLRDMRKTKFGGHKLDGERLGKGLWRYRLVPNTGEKPDESLLPGDLADKCQSPIEKSMLAGLLEKLPKHFTVQPQARINYMTVDFAVTGGARKMVVECDGHDYHERTKEQAASDKSRDRRLQAAGWLVFRFTGSEIFRDARACADEVLRACSVVPE